MSWVTKNSGHGRRQLLKLTVDSSHDEADLCSIRRTCEVGVDLLVFGLVE